MVRSSDFLTVMTEDGMILEIPRWKVDFRSDEQERGPTKVP